ncbi:hypothetical protein ON010_g16756 [Phytophthora cinnamomi]|nr:hypothetical protein ON010_g16756 [Phytophthora cinnamomi]
MKVRTAPKVIESSSAASRGNSGDHDISIYDDRSVKPRESFAVAVVAIRITANEQVNDGSLCTQQYNGLFARVDLAAPSTKSRRCVRLTALSSASCTVHAPFPPARISPVAQNRYGIQPPHATAATAIIARRESCAPQPADRHSNPPPLAHSPIARSHGTTFNRRGEVGLSSGEARALHMQTPHTSSAATGHGALRGGDAALVGAPHRRLHVSPGRVADREEPRKARKRRRAHAFVCGGAAANGAHGLPVGGRRRSRAQVHRVESYARVRP